MLAYIHPISAGLILLLLAYAGSLGLRSRQAAVRNKSLARRLLAEHARWAPIAYGLVVASWLGGALSTWWLRRDLEFAASQHFQVGLALVVMLTGGWLTSRWMRRPEMRAAHPWLGIAALLLAAAQVFFGLQITP